MENLNKTQKIVLVIIGGLVIILIIIYFFTKDSTIYMNNNEIYFEEKILDEKNNEEDLQNLIYVYVTGEVNNPSVLKLQEGVRVIDAIEKAGGITDSAEIKNLNLAYKLKDGDKLYIPSLDEVIESRENDNVIQYISNGIQNDNIVKENSNNILLKENKDSDIVNINSATQTELEMLDGIGPSTAKKIIEYREENGRFISIEDIKNVPGIGDSKYNSIKNKICV